MRDPVRRWSALLCEQSWRCHWAKRLTSQPHSLYPRTAKAAVWLANSVLKISSRRKSRVGFVAVPAEQGVRRAWPQKECQPRDQPHSRIESARKCVPVANPAEPGFFLASLQCCLPRKSALRNRRKAGEVEIPRG